MKHLKLLLLVFTTTTILVVIKAQGADDDDAGNDMPDVNKDGGINRMKKNQIALYEALHHFALPDVDISKPVKQRFILQIPGKVLNPMDYYPGKDYEEYLKNPHSSSKEIQIPPMVMERMFQLSDVVPGAHPLTGGETGDSLARKYENILGTMDVMDFAELTAKGKNVYDESLDKLLEPLPDPDNSGSEVPLLQLYSKFQKAYHDEQKKMEKEIKTQQTELSAVEYQDWFKTNFHILNAQVEGAYTQWLLHGRKHLVESYIAHFDITSSGEILEDARVKMRSSGFSSLDRSQVVYPVSFTPSNWYEYLKNKEAPLTRDQIQAKLEYVKTRITLLEAMLDTTSDELDETNSHIEEAKKVRDEKVNSLKESTKNLEEARKSCWFDAAKTCEIEEKESEVSEALSESSAASLRFETLEFQFGAKSQMKDQINVVLAKLKGERDQLERQLAESDPSSTSSLVENVGTTEPLEAQEIQDNWLSFDFSSTKSSKEQSSKSVKTGMSFSFSTWLPLGLVGSPVSGSVGGALSSSVGHQSFSEHVKSADVKVKAKLLKVKINRPWFRSDLFANKEFKLQRDSIKVSPGPLMEKTFSELSYDQYMLFQYPTAFLLAKDVTMEFSGLDAKTKQSALSTSFGLSSKGNFGPFSFGSGPVKLGLSPSMSTSSNNMRASATADGLKIELPGAQIIGYYCDVVPKFPNPISELRPS